MSSNPILHDNVNTSNNYENVCKHIEIYIHLYINNLLCKCQRPFIASIILKQIQLLFERCININQSKKYNGRDRTQYFNDFEYNLNSRK